MNLAKQHENNKEAITVIYSSLLLVSKIFYSLNSQEIPEFFEDNMKVWMPNFHTLLTTEIPLLKTAVSSEINTNPEHPFIHV
jgi:exportin-2 (importin alpha re-exporter)